MAKSAASVISAICGWMRASADGSICCGVVTNFFRDLQLDHPADFYFTSITADNVRSLRFLERGLPGMPVYKPIADFVTLLIPVVARAGRRFDSKKYTHRMPVPLSTVLEFLNSQARQYNLAAVWDEEKIHSSQHHGLPLANFQWLMDGEKIVACSALWDQRSFKQIVIRGYSPGSPWSVQA